VPTNRVPAWDNGSMSAKTAEAVSLRHVIVVGGTLPEWQALPDDQWRIRLSELGKVTDHVGASWLTIRPFESGTGASPSPLSSSASAALGRTAQVGGCLVVADPVADGRARLAAAVAGLQASGTPITEATIDGALNSPALADPDLVVVIGPPHRMPPSLVWELAYSELVFVETSWQHFGPGHLV